jgi:hypothetical protein
MHPKQHEIHNDIHDEMLGAIYDTKMIPISFTSIGFTWFELISCRNISNQLIDNIKKERNDE